MKQLDPGRIIQDIIQVYDAAKQGVSHKVALEVKGDGHCVIDGVEVGMAPGTFEVSSGKHLVQLVGAERETRGTQVTVGGPASVEIADAVATELLKIKRARNAMSHTKDAATRAGAMKQLANILNVHDAVLISRSDDGTLLVQTWREPEPGFSKFLEYRGTEKPIDILEPLSPPRPPEPGITKPPPFTPPPIVVEKAWYQRRWVQGSMLTGALAVIIGGIVLSRHQTNVGVAGNPQWVEPVLAR
jgi:hypothetical protein